MRTKGLKTNRQKTEAFRALANVITSRANLAQKLGQSYGDDRKLYAALGYPDNITFERYNGRYHRQDVAKRVVNAYPDATWRADPVVRENEEDKDTPLEKEWRELLKSVDVYHYMHRVDKVAGIGRYGVLLLGFNDGASMAKEVRKKRNLRLVYLQPYDENHATIKTKVTKKNDPRFGLPESYTITPDTEQGSNRNAGLGSQAVRKAGSFEVHWTRIIHVADGTLTSDVYGTPRMECVYNRLQDLELLTGGSAEMYWRGAFPGYAFNVDAGAELPSETVMEAEVEDYMHSLSRYMRLQGIETTELKPQVSDPKGAVDVQIAMISGGTGIPQRILTGSEQGELASSQDSNNWNARVEERRKNFAEPAILRALIDRLTKYDVLPPSGDEGYDVVWPPMVTLDEEKASTVAKNIAEAVAKYAGTPGATEVLPPYHFYTMVLKMDPDDAKEILDEAEKLMAEEDEQARADQEEFERQKAEEEKRRVAEEKKAEEKTGVEE